MNKAGYNVPLELLRYRKENGRICSSVLSYERERGILHDTDQDAQHTIAQFLRDKDPEKTTELLRLIQADGQKEPAIITCDGFLIDGNRRRVVLDELNQTHPDDSRFASMKVAILPGPDEPGGPPTLKEIEQIENRYQLQRTGKAAYYGFDAALSIRQKIDRGFSLADQLRDDPEYKTMGAPEFKKIVRGKRKELLRPLECIDRYLDSLERSGQYRFVSTGVGDREGRWQAFVEYSEFCTNKLHNQRHRSANGIEEADVPNIEQAAFKVIRLRTVPGMGKVHVIMRALPKYCKHAKQELLELNTNVKQHIPDDDKVDDQGNPLPLHKVDHKWANKYRSEITHRITKAHEAAHGGSAAITSLNLLRDALTKLTHPKLDIATIPIDDLQEAQKIANHLQRRAKALASEIYDCDKQVSRYRRR